MNQLKNIHQSFCFTMGLYGITRSIRADKQQPSKSNITIANNAFINSIVYAYPVINIIPLYKLYKRIEIEKKQLDKHDNSMFYREFSGHCFDTY